MNEMMLLHDQYVINNSFNGATGLALRSADDCERRMDLKLHALPPIYSH